MESIADPQKILLINLEMQLEQAILLLKSTLRIQQEQKNTHRPH